MTTNFFETTEIAKRMASFKLPRYDELNNFDVYMDQLVQILDSILYEFLVPDEENALTPSMINNYVKLKIIPSPEKKKYSRVHLAYLIIVCILKQTLSISTIQNVIPLGLTEDEVKNIYTSFVKNQRKAYEYVSDNVSKVANNILVNEDGAPDRINDIIMQVANSANIFKMLSEIICSDE
jgi:hypothetical protein